MSLGLPSIFSRNPSFESVRADGDVRAGDDVFAGETVHAEGYECKPVTSNPADSYPTIWYDSETGTFKADNDGIITTAEIADDTQVLYNTAGAIDGNSKLTYDSDTNTLNTYKLSVNYTNPTGYSLFTVGGARIGDSTFLTDTLGGISDVAIRSTNGSCCLGNRSYHGIIQSINSLDDSGTYGVKFVTGSSGNLIMKLDASGLLSLPLGGLELPTLSSNPGMDALWYDGTNAWFGSNQLTNQQGAESAGDSTIQLSDGTGGFIDTAIKPAEIDIGVGGELAVVSDSVNTMQIVSYDTNKWHTMFNGCILPSSAQIGSMAGVYVRTSTGMRGGFKVMPDAANNYTTEIVSYNTYNDGSTVRNALDNAGFSIVKSSAGDIEFRTTTDTAGAGTTATNKLSITTDGFTIPQSRVFVPNVRVLSTSTGMTLSFLNESNSNELTQTTDIAEGTYGGPMYYSSSSNRVYVDTSSRRYKENIVARQSGWSEFVKNIEIVNFNYRRLNEFDRNASDRKLWTGIIAEDLYTLDPQAVEYRHYSDIEIAENGWQNDVIKRTTRFPNKPNKVVNNPRMNYLTFALIEQNSLRANEITQLQSNLDVVQQDFAQLQDNFNALLAFVTANVGDPGI